MILVLDIAISTLSAVTVIVFAFWLFVIAELGDEP